MDRMTLPTKALAAARVCLALIVASLLLSQPGCDGGGVEDLPEVAKVSGIVTYKGQPVEGAEVTFTPETGNPALGITGADGRFEPTTYDAGDGAVPGKHKITIKVFPREALPGMEAETAGVSVPAKYGDLTTTPLSEEVKAGEQNEFTFDLED